MRFFTWGEKLGRPECPYMRRWALNFGFFSLRIHHWYSSDDPRYFHDHPWWFVTLVISGSYTDVSTIGNEPMTPGTIRYRPALHRHTVSVSDGGCWTFMITGPTIRKWGFWVNGKFRKANKFFFEHGHHPCN